MNNRWMLDGTSSSLIPCSAHHAASADVDLLYDGVIDTLGWLVASRQLICVRGPRPGRRSTILREARNRHNS